MRKLRTAIAREFPDLIFFFAPADIVTQVLNFGLQAPIDIQVAGPPSNHRARICDGRRDCARAAASAGRGGRAAAAGADTPDLRVNVDRTLASQVGVTQTDVASDLLVSLSSSNQTAPNYWLDPNNGVQLQHLSCRRRNIRWIPSTIWRTRRSLPASTESQPADTQLLSNLARTDRGLTRRPTSRITTSIRPSMC